MAKRTSNKTPKQAPKKASVEETQVDTTDPTPEGQDQAAVEVETKSKPKSKAPVNPKHIQLTPKEIDEQMDRRVRMGVRDSINRDIKSGLFVRQLSRRWGVDEERAKTAILKITDQIDKLIGVEELSKG